MELFIRYDVTLNVDGVKSVFNAALNVGHILSGKSKEKFIGGVKPYLGILSKVAKVFDYYDFVKFN